MSLFLVTAPSGEPLTLQDARDHLNQPVADEDSQIQRWIVAARQYAETFTRRALLTQTWDLKLDRFPCTAVLELPMPPVSAVSSITYLDTANVSQTWASSNYLTDLPTGPHASPARITPAYGVSYPSTYGVMNAVTIRLVCGYGAASAVPDSIKAAMLLSIGHWHHERSLVNVGNIVSEMPHTIGALLWPYKVW